MMWEKRIENKGCDSSLHLYLGPAKDECVDFNYSHSA